MALFQTSEISHVEIALFYGKTKEKKGFCQISKPCYKQRRFQKWDVNIGNYVICDVLNFMYLIFWGELLTVLTPAMYFTQ